jgi:hypothetical protein
VAFTGGLALPGTTHTSARQSRESDLNAGEDLICKPHLSLLSRNPRLCVGRGRGVGIGGMERTETEGATESKEEGGVEGRKGGRKGGREIERERDREIE